MATFALVTTILSILLITGFIALSVRKFGLLTSYSAYNVEWDKAVPMHNVHLWSIVTFVIAFLFMFATIEVGTHNPWQFLGFFAPLYLFIVAIFPITDPDPKWNEMELKEWKTKRVIHVIGAIGCAVAIVSWVLLVCHLWWVCVVALAVVIGLGLATKTLKKSLVLWGEMALFISGYTAILISML